MNLSIKNGFIWVRGQGNAPDWLDEEEGRVGVYTAPMNSTTVPLALSGCDDGSFSYAQADYEELSRFVQNPENQPPKLVEPPGIKLEPYQRDAVSRCLTHRRFALFFGMGTGKTLMAISILLSRKIETALVVTTKKMVSQYRGELDKYAPGKRYEVTNYEMLHKFRDREFEALILDESQAAKNFMTVTNRLCRELAKKCPCCYLFTGTPQDKSRHEILAQLAILDWRVMPTKSRTVNRYFNLNDYYEPKSEKRERKRELSDLIAAYSYGMKASDVMELSQQHILIYRCPHPFAYYDDLNEDRVIQEIANGKRLSVVGDTPATLRTFLQEICDGTVPFVATEENEDGDSIQTPCPRHFGSTKDATLTSIASKIPKGILYFWFRCSIPNLERSLAKAGRTYAIVDGTTTGKKADEAIGKFKEGEIDWLVMQERSGNAGLDLSMVNNVVFYDLPSSYLVYSQCKGRIRRRGQTKECNYHHLLCEGTVEESMLEALRRKKNYTDRLFLMYMQGESKCKKER